MQSGGWMNVQEWEGTAIPRGRGEQRGSPCGGQTAKPFKAPQWQNLKTQPPVPKPTWLKAKHILKQLEAGEERHFQKSLCQVSESLSMPSRLASGNEGLGEGQSVLEPTLNMVFLLGGMIWEDLMYYSLPLKCGVTSLLPSRCRSQLGIA